MSTWLLIWQQIKHFIEQSFFYIKNKIRKPKEVLVIVAKVPKRHLNRSSRIYK
jgi:hypothetical protein